MPILALFGTATVRLMPVFNQVISQTATIQYNAASVEAVYEDLKILENEYQNVRKDILKGRAEKLSLKESITLQNIHYSYPEQNEQAVPGDSLKIKRGEAIAFVGESGAGKTTMADLILGLLEPNEGKILVDDVDIESNIRGWQQNIGYIPQQIFLLDDTIRRNIAFGIPDDQIDETKIEAAV